MLEEQIELIESFKLYKISSVIEQISARIFAALKHPKFNPEIAPYFTKVNTEGQPFTQYELDPDNVSQIKKLLNALYYARITFWDLEHVNLKKDFATKAADVWFLYKKTVNDAYEASFLLTHLDVDIQAMFQDELQLLVPLFGQLQTLASKSSESTKSITASIKDYSLSYKVGEVTGTAIEQMKPSSGSMDYEFLTTFSATLPSYIDKITQYIQQYSSQLIAQEPTLNNKKLEELQATALGLLNDLEHLRGGSSLFVSLKFLKYIHIISSIITLTTSAIEQIGNLSESSQDVLRDNLAQLKYYLLPQLFGLVDKIEVNCMLKPGTLSIPLMEKVKPLYQTLIYYASKPVNFKAKGEELLSIEDSRFLSLRLEKTYERRDKADIELFKLKKVQEACSAFFTLLSRPEHKDLPLHALSQETIDQLAEYYKLLKPYMAHVAPDLNKQIITALLDKNKAKPGYLLSKWLSFTDSLPSDHISFILAKQQALVDYIKKKKNTQQFHIDLNTTLIASVQKETDLVLFPYSDTTSIITTEQIEKIADFPFAPEEGSQLYVRDEEGVLKAAEENNPNIQFAATGKNKTIVNPDQLSADQTLVLYQWYRGKLTRFQAARKAYNEFIELLENQIKELYPIPQHALTFNQLKEANRTKLRALYNQFRAYFNNGVPEEMQTLATKFDKYLNYKPTDESLPDAPILADFRQLHQHLNGFFEEIDTTWTKQSQFYLKQAKHKYASEEQNVFLIDESRALRSAGPVDPLLKFSKSNGKKEVADPKRLKADQALVLYQWYRNKRDKFLVAQRAYTQFIQLLNEQAKKHPSPQGVKFTLNQLDKDVKLECRKLYNLFQPYFINGVLEPMKKAALAFDRYLVHSFSEDVVTDNTPTIDMFEKLDEHFQVYFTSIDRAWAKKSRAYLTLAHEKFALENKEAQLAHDAHADRAHYLLKHTKYSKFIFEFRQALQQVTSLFNSSMQAQLKIKKTDGIPYPELEEPHTAIAQSKQVLAIKEIYNYLYHIEQIVRQIENLNDKAFKTEYVTYLIIAYKHLHQIIKLTKSLSEDTHFKLISGELLEKAQNMWATIQENLEPYQEAAEEVVPKDKTVQFSGLWYTLNAFNVIPKHIRSLRDTTYLTQEDLDELHLSAKKASLTIEKLISSSNSYFKLFLQVPNMIGLYQEFKGRLAEFITTLHDSSKNNLGEFHHHVFTPMLLEADNWEDKLGLAPGTFSGPLRKIINEYYKGLLHPLKLHSHTHIAFVCDKAPLKERTEITQQKALDATTHLKKLEQNYQKVIELDDLIKQHEKLTGSFFAPDPEAVAKLIVQIKQVYKEALPKLVSLKRVLNFSPEKLTDADITFDARLNDGLKEYDVKLTGIKELVKLSYSHYLGLKNTYKMKLDTAKEKLTYLTELSVIHDEESARYLVEYTTASFDKQCEELVSRHVGLQYVDKEYKAKLKNHLLNFKENIILKAKSEFDINLSIKELLKEKIRHFEQDNFVKYYQLDNIRVALAQFKNYFSLSALAIEKKNALYEDDETLRKKTDEINKLVLIAENELLSIDERILQIKHQVNKNSNFSRVILEQKKVDTFSFAYLALCFLSLLEALHLYTPTKNARLNDLKKSVDQEFKLTDLTNRFGLFTTTKAVQPEPPMEQEAALDFATP